MLQRSRWLWLVAVGAKVFVGCGSDAVEQRDCWFAVPAELGDRQIICGTVEVPEQHRVSSGRSLAIAYAQIRALNQSGQRKPPVVYLQGGPGGNIVDSAVSFAQRVAPVLAKDRDLLLIDQRGTGRSQPSLGCPPVTQTDADADAVLRDCRDHLSASGINLAAYNTVENAADVVRVANKLGYSQMVLYGSSYGTLLAQQILRDQPQAVVGAVLDAVVPKQPSYLAALPRSANDALEALLSACAADPDCSARQPDLRANLFATLRALERKPLALDLARFPENPTLLALTPEVFLSEFLVDGLMFDGLGSRVPQVVAYADGALEDPWAQRQLADVFRFFRTGSGAAGGGVSLPMFFSVVCSEGGIFEPTDIESAGVAPEVMDVYRPRAEAIRSQCAIWAVPPLSEAEREPVRSDIPTLLLSGAFDPRTPPRFAEAVAPGLSRATSVTVPGAGHGTILASSCTDRITARFIADPQATVDLACLDGLEARFRAPQGLDLAMDPSETARQALLPPNLLPW